MATSCVFIPTNEITSVLAETGTFVNLKLPSASVIIPVFVPFTCTDAPITGSPSSSAVTVPVTCLSWAIAKVARKHKQTNKKINSFFISNSF